MSAKETPPLNEPKPSEAGQAKPETATGWGDHFRRGHMTWGRPPQVTFRAGPLPRDEGLARLMAMPPHPQSAQPQIRGSTATGLDQPLVGFGAEEAKSSHAPSVRSTNTADQAASMPAPSPLFGSSLVPGVGNALTPALKVPAPEPAPVEETRVETVVEERFEMAPVVVTAPRKTDSDKVKQRSSPKRGKLPVLMIVAVVVLGAVCAGVWWSQNEGGLMPSKASNTPAVTAPQVPDVPEALEAPLAAGVPVAAVLAPVEPVVEPVVEPAKVTAKVAPVLQDPAPQARPATSASDLPVPQREPVPNPSVMPQIVVPAVAEAVAAPTVAQSGPVDPNSPIVTRPQKLD